MNKSAFKWCNKTQTKRLYEERISRRFQFFLLENRDQLFVKYMSSEWSVHDMCAKL